MGTTYERIDDPLRAFIEAQHVFFVATAPLRGGHINLSPKGLGQLRVLGPTAIAYLDHVGSGAETIAHLRENGRIVLMLCAFDGAPRIVRLHGTGEVLEPQHDEYQRVRSVFGNTAAPERAIIRVCVARVSTSCGFGVPVYTFERDRSQIVDWASRKGAHGLQDYQMEKNRVSIDGLPALRWPESMHLQSEDAPRAQSERSWGHSSSP
jgi:hypothetical protein